MSRFEPSEDTFYESCPNSVCAFDWRYGSPQMKYVLSRREMLRNMILVEIALMDALVEVGLAPPEAAEKIREAAKKITPEEVAEREKQTGHEVIALVELLAEKGGDEVARWVHYGATSNDIIDTAWALTLRDALVIIESKLAKIIEALATRAEEYVDVVMVGRTHGQHALPITLGFKFANYTYELARSYERLCSAMKRVLRAKIGGAVGTMAAWGRKGLRIREIVCEQLGLEPHIITTQVAPRDGFAELASVLAILASQLDRFATEIRELARPEIMEMWEDRTGKLGSSAMPHKANPVTAERISGLARVARSLVTAFLENIVLWHERDLSNSSAERIIIPHLLLTIDQMLDDTWNLILRLRWSPERMYENLMKSRGAIMAEALMNLLIRELGMKRPDAYRIAKELAEKAAKTGKPLYEVAAEDPRVGKYFGLSRLYEELDPRRYLGPVKYLVQQAVYYADEVLEKCEL
ncbi:Adenylosuccinate lyase [Pyrodictium delaneyi]|uniref:Adenylosuccinate lyase n=2 Tax=Pyrodictium delaneyi TaxID=1273541 RepID=A0A0P0N2S1_9CREN|nr:adenylosuccinate lyase [Pyrodictium delaneyi]ALL00839.1 Adenylosuccinate lyase [Pyrodictium delaneyi]